MPAVLVETAFISNPEEEKKLASPVFQQSVADGIARAIAGYFARRKEPPATPRPSASTGSPAGVSGAPAPIRTP